jgi:S-adenosylmethionine hydrolase
MSVPRPVFLLTDFGIGGYYAGVMRGVIAARAPGCAIHDLSHGIRPGHCREAAYVLEAALPFLPADAVVVVVVDPGVGSPRRILGLRLRERSLLAPDNGILTPFFEDPQAVLHQVDREDLSLPERSRTFHGRDVFAPVAASLATGLREEELGVRVADPFRLEIAAAREEPPGLRGEIVYVDPFGNLVSNIDRATLQSWRGDRRVRVSVKGAIVGPVVGTYADVAVGQLLAYVGSTGHLEVAVRDGRADTALGAGVGATIDVEVSA